MNQKISVYAIQLTDNFEQASVITPQNGQLVFAGSSLMAIEFVKNSIAKKEKE